MQDTSRLRILDLGLVSSLDSQAIYHAVAACMTESSADTVIICRPRDPYFCIGHHQNVRQVIDTDTRLKLGHPIVRRRLGGGLTYLDSNQLFYQCIFHKTRSPVIPAQVYKKRLREPINLLNRIGVAAELRYLNEIEVSGRRIAGIGGGMIGEASVVVGNVLRDFDIEMMAKMINAPCVEFREMAANAMTARITTLNQEGVECQWQALPEILIDEYKQQFGSAVYMGHLSDEERETAHRLALKMTSEKYLSEFQNVAGVSSLTRLKISASTFIELVLVHQRNYHQLRSAIVTLKDGVVEALRYTSDLDDRLSEFEAYPGIRTVHANDLELGMRLE